MSKITVRGVARICHEALRGYAAELGEHTPLKAWEDCEDWVREAATRGVHAVLARPEMTGEEIHVAWMKDREVLGWKYGPVKDEEKKEHPCMVPYERLSKEVRVKDEIFGAIVRTLLKAGFIE